MTSSTSERSSKLKLQSFKGRYGVDIGQSLSRTWSVRTGKPIKRKPQFPNLEFYAMRYKEIPPRLNPSASGTLMPKASNSESRTYELERPSQTAGTTFTFNAVEQISQNANTWECLLIYKPDTQSFTLEKLESTLNVSYARQGKSSRPVGSPSATPPTNPEVAPSPASSESYPTTKAKKAASSKKEKPKANAKSKKKDEDFDDLEKMLLRGAEEDGGGNDAAEAAEELERMINEEIVFEKEEEEEEDMVAVDVDPIPPPMVAAPPPKAKASAKARAAATKEKPKPRPRPAKRKPPPQVDDEVEIFFGGTSAAAGASPTKKSRVDPPLAPPPVIPTPSDILQPPPAHAPEISYDDSESEASDQDGMLWDEIQDLGGGHDDAEGEVEEEEDLDDPLFGAPPTPTAESGRPLTLNEYASEFNGGNDIDEDSSSDDSDDD